MSTEAKNKFVSIRSASFYFFEARYLSCRCVQIRFCFWSMFSPDAFFLLLGKQQIDKKVVQTWSTTEKTVHVSLPGKWLSSS